MVRSCSTCYWHLGLGRCARNLEPLCAMQGHTKWVPILVHATAVDAARYVEAIRYQGPGVTITRREDGKYDLRLEGI